MTLADYFREIGLTAREMRETPARHAALRDDPAALALRLFRDRATLSEEECACLLGDARTRLVVDGRALWKLDIIDGLYLFSEWPPGETTAILFRAACAFARPGDIALDLGCGSGTLALLLARSVDRVVGSDVDTQAIALARLNADLNGVRNVEFRLGSLYEPVIGEQFDLVVSQPPYVPRPDCVPSRVFLHGGPRGDELARAILAGLSSHLAPMGRGLVYSDWPLFESESLRNRAAAPGLRTRLFASPPVTAASYAEAYGEELEAHFAELGVSGVRQCLAVCEAGAGIVEYDVLPHEWREIASIVRRVA